MTYKARDKKEAIFFLEALDHIACICLIHSLLLSLHFSMKKMALAIIMVEIQNIAAADESASHALTYLLSV